MPEIAHVCAVSGILYSDHFVHGGLKSFYGYRGSA